MDERHNADYALAVLSYETASENLDHAKRFVERVNEVLIDQGFLS